jgi:hypothetical protein
VLEGDRQIPVQTPRLGANFVPQSRDLAIPRERKPVEDFRRYVLAISKPNAAPAFVYAVPVQTNHIGMYPFSTSLMVYIEHLD